MWVDALFAEEGDPEGIQELMVTGVENANNEEDSKDIGDYTDDK